eukprot:gene544-439_t
MTVTDTSALYVNITPKAREFLAKLGNRTKKKYKNDEEIDIDDMKNLIDKYNEEHEANIMMHDILEGCHATTHKRSSRQDLTPLEEMRALSDERKYQKQIEGVKPAIRKSHDESMSEVGLASKTTAFAGQFVMSFAGAFALGYYFVETFIDPNGFEAKIIAGGVVSFFTLILEAILFIIYEEKERMRKQIAAKKENRANRAAIPKKNAKAKKED